MEDDELMVLQSGNRFFFWSRRGVVSNEAAFAFDALGPLPVRSGAWSVKELGLYVFYGE